MHAEQFEQTMWVGKVLLTVGGLLCIGLPLFLLFIAIVAGITNRK
jgi:hypothetical protein